uniref:Ferrichrome-iron receptor n=1 Tax=Tolypothrix bouteillei VB521301 TaxID=1479485 RepID=A0A0C1QX24_9CYAN
MLLTGVFVVLIVIPAKGEKLSKTNVRQSLTSTKTSGGSKQTFDPFKAQKVEPTRKIQQLSEVLLPIKNAQMLLQPLKLTQAASSEAVVLVTAVRAVPTKKGLEVILETSKGQQLQVQNRSSGNSLIVDIPNAQLRLPSGDEFQFQSEKPIAGITEIKVSNQDASTIRVVVIGEKEIPQVELFDSNEGLIFGLMPTGSIAQSPQPSETQQPEPQKPPGDIQPKKPSSTTDELIELLVTGKQDRYNVLDATTATRTDTPIRDIPQSIQIVPRRVIEDQQVIQLDEALRNVSGVVSGGFDTTTETRYSIRGFEGAPVLIDGFRQYGFPSTPETANLERVEVLKGPASILYGEIQPGGVINAVTKKPLSEPFYEAEFQAGNFGLLRPRIDISGPLTRNNNLLYRLNALYLNSDGFRDFDQEFKRFFVSPVLTWNISDRTNITFELQYSDSERPSDNGLLAFGRGVIETPRSRIFNEPDDYIERNFLNTGYTLEHRFSDNWTIRNAFRYINQEVFSDKLTVPFTFDATTGILNRIFAFDDFDSKDYSLQTNIVGKFATGSVKHTLLFGVDLNRNNSSDIIRADFFNPSPINVFNPVYRNSSRPALVNLALDRKSETSRLGVYLQDQIALLDNLKLLAGLRYETFDQKVTNEVGLFSPTGDDPTQNANAWTPRLGIVYQPIQQVSLYASYSKSFIPNTDDFTSNGDPLEPERGEGYEVGVKAELLQGSLSATLAYFDITKQNVATTDPNALGFGSIATGEQQSQGIELDISGEISPGWNIIASYAYTDAEVTKDNNSSIIGNRFSGIPKHSASLWTTYQIQRGNLQGLGFGVGFNYVGNREGDLENTFRLGSYFLTNAAIFYRRDNWRVALNFKNLFNIDYITGSPFSRVNGIYPGEPFTVIGSIAVQL